MLGGGGADAADLGDAMAVKAPQASAPADWTGLYVGVHLGYAAGSSNWSATSTAAGAPALAGSLDLYNGYGLFTGTGSYLVGLQAGYDYISPSRILLGIEADASFPNTIAGTATLTAPSIGAASYAEQVEFSGTVRGRIGYAPGPWLFYATLGFAYSYDQFTRTQLAGMPAGGTAVPGAADTLFMVPRVGGAAGIGAELALTPHWAARLEYLFTDYASRGVSFPAGAQRFDSDLALQTLRVGLDYQLGQYQVGNDGLDPAVFITGLAPLDLDRAVAHGQGTFIEQYAAPFRAPYSGANSLAPNSGRETGDIMLAGGFKLWRGAELWIDPELGQGFGLSNTEGIAGFPSGAAFRVGASVPYPRIQRTFIRQTIDLGGDSQKVDADFNQFSGTRTADRLVVTIGKYRYPTFSTPTNMRKMRARTS